jgi:hypothetical protein
MNMRTTFWISPFAALLFLAGSLQAQPGGTDAVGFSQSINKKKKELYAAGKEYGVKLSAVLQKGNPEDIAALKVAYVDSLILIAKVEEEWQTIQAPPGKSGKDLHAAVGNFLKQQRQFMQTDGLTLLRIVQNKDWNMEEKTKRLLAVIDVAHQAEKDAEAALEKVHKVFREEYKIK